MSVSAVGFRECEDSEEYTATLQPGADRRFSYSVVELHQRWFKWSVENGADITQKKSVGHHQTPAVPSYTALRFAVLVQSSSSSRIDNPLYFLEV
jgi:hypothetical protein